MEFSLKKITETNQVRFLLLTNNGNHLTISEILYDILSCYKNQSSSEYIYSEISKKYDSQNISTSFIDKTLASVFEKLNKIDSTPNADPLNHKITLIKEGQLQKVYQSLAVLHNKYIMGFVIITSILSTIFFFQSLTSLSLSQIYRYQLTTFSISNLLIIYGSFLFIILWHEMGHASASMRFGIKPKEIGFGFYFIFPVFFTNVTNIWQLNVKSRNIVNFGGIYFQLIVNILLIFFLYIGVSKPIIFPMIFINLTSIIGSLNPFFRYDGYWVFSDYFNFSNLKSRTQDMLLKSITNFPVSILKIYQNESKILLLYVFSNTLFWIYVYYQLCVYMYNNVNHLTSIFQEGTWNQSQMTIIDTTVSLGTTFVISYLIVIQITNNYKLLKNEKGRISYTKTKFNQSQLV
jgi:putative peptide zinc metalloprotease protein